MKPRPSADDSYRFLAARYLRKQAKRLATQIDGTRKGDDPECVHQARVASRRMRAALRVFDGCFDAERSTRWAKEIRRVTGRLGEARDIDVQIELLCDLLASIEQPACYPGVARLLAKLQRRRDRVQPKVAEAADRIEASGVLREIRTVAKQVLAEAEANGTGQWNSGVLDRTRPRILEQLAELLSHQDSLDRPEDQQQHHAMRIAAKRLRYTLEIFSPAYRGRLDASITALKRVQTLLGEVHDCDVWVERLATFAAKEQKRIEKYYGHGEPMARLQVGIEHLAQQQRQRRERAFGELIAFWRELAQGRRWEELEAMVNGEAMVSGPDPRPKKSKPPIKAPPVPTPEPAGPDRVARTGPRPDRPRPDGRRSGGPRPGSHRACHDPRATHGRGATRTARATGHRRHASTGWRGRGVTDASGTLWHGRPRLCILPCGRAARQGTTDIGRREPTKGLAPGAHGKASVDGTGRRRAGGPGRGQDGGGHRRRLQLHCAWLIAEVCPTAASRSSSGFSGPCRLGQDTFRRGRLGGQSMRAAVAVLRDYKQLLELYKVERVRAVATSAVREASNADTFLDRVFMATGLNVEVIATSEESRLTVSAVRRRVGDALGVNHERGADRRGRRRQHAADRVAGRRDRHLAEPSPGLDPPAGDARDQRGIARSARPSCCATTSPTRPRCCAARLPLERHRARSWPSAATPASPPARSASRPTLGTTCITVDRADFDKLVAAASGRRPRSLPSATACPLPRPRRSSPPCWSTRSCCTKTRAQRMIVSHGLHARRAAAGAGPRRHRPGGRGRCSRA